MPNSIMILGGYGNFGKRIAKSLVAKNIDILIVGRQFEKSKKLADQLGPLATPLSFEVPNDLAAYIDAHEPVAIVNTVGPFQFKTYETARIAIERGVNYIDLADGRSFVNGIGGLDVEAKQAGVSVISGASTVPALSDAVLAAYAPEFSSIEMMRYGIAPGQGAERGLATTKGILSYVGKPLAPFNSVKQPVFGWQDLYRQNYPGLGKRWMANCDVPDLDLLPQKYGIGYIQFSAGLELSFMHLGLYCLGWIRRLGLPLPLEMLASPLLKLSNLFNKFGSSDGGMHIILLGRQAENLSQPHKRSWFIIAREGHGPHIPTVPAILIAARMAKGEKFEPGAYPCLGLVALSDYLTELEPFNIDVVTQAQ